MSDKTIRVLQGHSICFGGVWYNQGETLTVPANAEFVTNRPKYDEKGKFLGTELVSMVETIEPPKPAKQKKEEG